MATRQAPQKTLTRPAADLLTVARGLFYKRGYDATAVQDIVDGAGVTKGAFYHHFASKEEVLKRIFDEHLDRQLGVLQAVLGSDLRPLDALKAVMVGVVGGLDEQHETVSVVMREHRALSARSSRSLTRKRERWQAGLQTIIQDGVREGDIADWVDVALVTRGIIGLCFWASEWFDPSGPLSAQEVADTYARMVLDGLRAAR